MVMSSLECPLAELEFVAFDLETTGCSADYSQVVEVGAVRFTADGRELARFEQLVDPRCRIPASVTAIHGITDAMVRGMPTLDAVLPALTDFLESGSDPGGAAGTIAMAHNARFDVGFLNRAYGQYARRPPQSPVIDSVRLARRQLRGLRRHTLAALAHFYAAARPTAHRGLDDSLVLKDVFLGLVREEPAPATLGDLLRLTPAQFIQPITGPARGGGRTAPILPADFADLQAAVDRQCAVSMVYHGGRSGPGRRSVTPRRLFQSRGVVYLVAFCHRDHKDKQFRIDRIAEFELEAGGR
jgi:DNA polymerase III epsilon subunit family exonuclease